jgi:hypothetical protein
MLMQVTKATEKELLTNNKLLSSKNLELHQTISKLRTNLIEKENAVRMQLQHSFVICCLFVCFLFVHDSFVVIRLLFVVCFCLSFYVLCLSFVVPFCVWLDVCRLPPRHPTCLFVYCSTTIRLSSRQSFVVSLSFVVTPSHLDIQPYLVIQLYLVSHHPTLPRNPTTTNTFPHRHPTLPRIPPSNPTS